MVEAPVRDGVETDVVERDSVGTGIALTSAQRSWLVRGLDQPGGKLPLFDRNGQRVSPRTIKSCLEHGWAEPWFSNPLKPEWLVCKLTPAGRKTVKPR
jgi:hypothetical protein